MSKAKGIDVSTFQGKIDWDQVKGSGKVEFAMLRMGYGNDLPEQDDVQFERNVSECDRVGMPWGAYLYSYAVNQEQAKSESEHILRLMEGKKPLYPVCLDVEDACQKGLTKEALTEIVYTILERVEAAGYYAMLYANKDWLENCLDMDRLGRFDVWLAQWNESPTYKGQFGIWQYTSEGSVPGIGGRVDLDETTGYRDYEEHIGQYYKPEEPEASGIRAGDTVRVTGRLYASSDGSGAGKTVNGTYSVDRVLPGKACPILIGNGLGWVRTEDCIGGQAATAIRKGDAVRVREGATAFATGESMASWVRESVLYVIQVGNGKVLVSTAPGGAATGWIKTGDLVAEGGGPVAPSEPEPSQPEPTPQPDPSGFAVGDAVKVRDGAEYFATGQHMASFVRQGVLYVLQVGSGKVLVSTAPGGAATGWIRTEDLVKA